MVQISAVPESKIPKKCYRKIHQVCFGRWRPLQQERSGLNPLEYRLFKKAIKDKDSGAPRAIREKAQRLYRQLDAVRTNLNTMLEEKLNL